MNPTLKARATLIFTVVVILALQVSIALLTALEYRMALLLIFGVTVVAITFINFKWMEPVLVFSLFIMGISLGGFEGATGGNIRIYHLIAAFLIVWWAFYALISRQERFFFPNAIVTPCLLIIGLAGLTIIWSPDLRFAVYRFIKVALSVGGALIFINLCKHNKNQHRVLWYWIFCGMVGGVIIYYSWYALDQGLDETWLAHQNIVSAMMNVVIFFSLGMTILTRRFTYRLISMITTVFAIMVNFSTGCRGGIIALMLGLTVFVVLGIFNSKAGRKFPVSFTAIFLVIVTIVVIMISRMESFVLFVSGRSFDLMDPMATDTLAWRVDTIRTAIGILNEHSAWIWGMGVGSWEYLQDIYLEYTWARFIHNFYFNFYFQYGVFGMVLLFWLFVRIFAPIVRAYQWFPDYQTRWFLNSLVALYACMAIHGLVSIEETNAYIWILFATTSIFMEHLKEQHDRGLPSNAMI